ncbi:MAG: HDOD domain-containing protein [Desulfonatronovibrio sp.]
MAMEDVQDLVPGLILAGDVVTPNGRLLLPRGIVLADRHISYLKKWGIARVNILEKKGSQSQGDEIKKIITEEVEGFLSPIYSRNDFQHPVVRLVYHLGVERLVDKALTGGWSPPRKEASMPVNDGRFRDEFISGRYNLKDLVKHEVQLSSFPDIYFKINEAINSSRSNADYLARIISNDVSLCAKLLRLVNSPFYGMTSRVDSVSRAIALLGADELSVLAMGISAISAFKDIPEELIDMKSFWTHSVAVGIISKSLARGLPDVSPERLFVGGLLHDMGKLIIFKKLAAASSEVIIDSQTHLLPLYESERDILGFDHSQAGALVAQGWRLPGFLQEQIGRHHESGKMPSKEAAITHLADFLAVGMVFTDKGSIILPPLNQSALEIIDLKPEKIMGILDDVDREFSETVSIFFG